MNFDSRTERRGTGSLKWDEDPKVDYPLWVADMDFRVAQPIVDALQRRVEHGIFGYELPAEDYYQSIIRWHQRRHQVEYQREWFITVPGIVPAVSAILRALTKPGDGVLLLSPCYNCFYSSIRNLQCTALECPLTQTEKEDEITFSINFEDLEKKASLSEAKVMILCSPHNPTGRVWSKDELQKIGDICLKHNVFVLSDEIHCEIVKSGIKFHSYASLGERYMSHACICTSASKTFNIAGLQNAQIICPDSALRAQIDRAVNVHEVCDVNPFGVVATQAAYDHGEEWLCALNSYVYENYQQARSFIREHLPMLRVCRMEATYLMWVDISALGVKDEVFCQQFKEQHGVWLAAGSQYGQGGENFVRINLATQRERLMQALKLVHSFIQNQGLDFSSE